MGLSKKLWASIGDVFASILEHPFIRGLTSGDLEEGKFKHYIIQDHIYLGEFRRVLSLAAAKSEREEAALIFLRSASEIIKVEEELHRSFLSDWGIGRENIKATVSPSNLLYTSYLFSVALLGTFNELAASVLPCYWIYMEVGRRLAEKGSPNPLYKRWIDTYGGQRYEEGVRRIIGVVDESKPSPTEEEKMLRNFRLAAIFEYMFWDSAYRLEKFPFPLETKA